MNPMTTHSFHGKERHIQRFRMPMEKLRQVLDHGGYQAITRDPGIFREYRLTYSPEDNAFMVVVQNHNSGKILTVWKPYMFERMIKKIPQEDYDLAKQKFEDAQNFLLNQPKEKHFIVACMVMNYGKPYVQQVGMLHAAAFDYDFNTLASSDTFADTLKQWCSECDIDMNRIEWISVKLGKKSNQYKVFGWEDGKLTN